MTKIKRVVKKSQLKKVKYLKRIDQPYDGLSLVSRDIPPKLRKKGMNAIYDNVPEDKYVDCGHILFAVFKEELCSKFIKGWDKNKLLPNEEK